MAEAAEARPRKPPPRLLMRAMNALPRLVLRSPLHGLMSENVPLLAFTGREKSGKRYVTPMSYVREGDTLLMSTEAPWWKNFGEGGGADLSVTLRGREATGVAEAIPDESGVVEGLDTIIRNYPGYSRFVGVTLDERGSSGPGDRREGGPARARRGPRAVGRGGVRRRGVYYEPARMPV